MNKKTSLFFDRLLSLLVFPANLALFVMMMITVADIIGRSVFNSPILGSVEVTKIALAIMIVCAFPLIVRDEGHISVDLLDNFIPQWLVPWRQLSIHLMSVIAISLLTWQLYKYTLRAFRYGDVTEFLRIPLGYVLAVMAIMGAVSVFSSLLRVWHYAEMVLGRHSQESIKPITSPQVQEQKQEQKKEHAHD